MQKGDMIDSSEAQKMYEEKLNIYMTPAAFRLWLQKWKKQYPDMVKQPGSGGHYHIDKKRFKEFINGA